MHAPPASSGSLCPSLCVAPLLHSYGCHLPSRAAPHRPQRNRCCNNGSSDGRRRAFLAPRSRTQGFAVEQYERLRALIPRLFEHCPVSRIMQCLRQVSGGGVDLRAGL
jgi:hypothetical protein